jgi:2-polyprenyl-3-methyl-5-hydroxy-6-metoxy-1,4-benzoquinol methylase
MSVFARARSKLLRARELGVHESRNRVAGRIAHAFGYRPTVRRLAFWLDRYSRRMYDGPYVERPEGGPINLEVKLERQRQGGSFESLPIVLVNRAAVGLIDDSQRSILEVGSGTGLFAWLAGADPRRTIVASEFDAPALAWATEHRSRPNIVYCNRSFEQCAPREFDLAVAIEVIEHLNDFGPFLRALSRVSKAAIVTTPNKHRTPFTAVARTPAFEEHVREWTSGEFLWVLRAFYARVDLFTIPDLQRQVAAMQATEDYKPRIAPCSDLICDESMIAVCRDPFE